MKQAKNIVVLEVLSPHTEDKLLSLQVGDIVSLSINTNLHNSKGNYAGNLQSFIEVKLVSVD